MEQAIIRRLKDGTLAPYRAAAKAKGRSLEAELRELIELNAPVPVKDVERLKALALSLQAMTLNPNHDSTPVIRKMRNAGLSGGND